MRKFIDFDDKRESANTDVCQRNSGGFNIQNTHVLNNNIVNKNYTDASENSDGVIYFLMVGMVLSTLVWIFFSYYEEIYLMISIGVITSSVLSVIALSVLFVRNEIDIGDFSRSAWIIFLGVGVFGLNTYLSVQIPQDIISISKASDSFIEFFKTVHRDSYDNYMKYVGSGLLICALVIGLCLSGFRELAYSLASEYRTGLWFGLYKLTNCFRMKLAGFGGVIIIVMAIVIVLISGVDFTSIW
ncbi:TPA: hypothetical protein HI065_000645 [Escherichia coli]|uniref:hypothetical protein n=1 Tax=Escherichia coli TaxID=562 RepID=UPI000F6D1910|nr:hypothetical protein [Escherichia coli]VED18601.1 Uncharacterised protein [Escherichia coli]HAH9831873.1 hypothetical protein [Escherichia coli]HAI2214583.1 hypothetical protein [Escherichia coli]